MRVEQIIEQIIGIVAIDGTILVLSLVFWLVIGLMIFAWESLAHQLKSPVAKRHLGAEDLRGWYKYLHYARRGLRVSQLEEARGSDGTFS